MLEYHWPTLHASRLPRVSHSSWTCVIFTLLTRQFLEIPEEMLVLMADIFPTGYFAAKRFLLDLPQRDRDEYTTVVIGCGPVGLCAITCGMVVAPAVPSVHH